MGFADALGILDSSSAPPPTQIQPSEAYPGRVPPQIVINRRSDRPAQDTVTSSFGSALGILSGEDIPPPAEKSETTQKRQTSIAESAGRGIASGLTANFYDELRGLHEAGGASPDDPMALSSIIKGAVARIAGDKEAEQRYTAATTREREAGTLAAEQHPVANIAGNVGGALMLPVGGALNATTMPARIARGAALGAGYGAAYGAGEGENLSDRATKAGAGALFGGAAGGAAAPILSGVSAAAGAIGRTTGKVLGHPIETFRGAVNPDQEAARRIGTNIRADIESGRPGMSSADLAAARATGQPTAIIDIGGENTRALGRSAANTSPAARAALEEMSSERFAGQSERVSNFVRDLVPTPGNATKTAEAIDAVERVANKGGYAAAYKAGDKRLISPELDRLMGSPDVQAAMRDAAEKGKSRAIADGMHVLFDKGKPNLQFYDYTYRSLRDSASAAFRAGRGDEGNYLKTIANQMRSELDRLVPEYAKARGVASQFFQAENALEAGQKFTTMRGPIEEARIAHAKMTQPQKALFAEGYVSDLADKVSKIADNRSVTIDRIFNSPDGRARTELALGKGRAQELELFLRRENMMDLARKALGNSTTARQLMEMGIAGAVGSAAGGAAEAVLSGKSPDYKTALSAALVGGAAGLGRKVNFKVAQRVGEMLASDDPKVLMTAIKMAKTNPDAGRALRRAETMLEKIVGQHSSGATPLLPAIAPGRAEDQQQ